MATSLGSITWGSGPALPCSWSYDRRRSGADMQYRVYGTVNVGGSTRYFGYYIDAYVSLDGTQRYSKRLKENSPSSWSGELTFDTGWITVSNKTSGSTSCTITLGTNAPRGNGSWSYTLAVDPAGSTISASNGTLGVAQTITLSRKNSSFTDTVTWSCGSQSGTIATKSSETSFTFTPDISLAAQNTAGTSVPITFTTTTYSGNTAVQSNSVAVTEAIPASVKPTAAVAIDDPTGYATTYGAYVQSKSTLHIVTTPTLSYNSPINSYSVTADGNIYNAAEVTTPVLQNTGAQAVSSVVTDKRGRASDAAVASYSVLAYAQPTLSTCEIHRCDADGTTNPEGHYMSISFTGTVTPLNNHNSAVWAIRYRVTGASSWTNVPLSSLTGNYSVTHQEIIAAADADTFEVQVAITDDFGTVIAGTGDIPIAFTIMNWRTEGDGMAIGGINTKDALQVYMPAEFLNDVSMVTPLPIESGGTDADNAADARTNLEITWENLGASENGKCIKFPGGTMIQWGEVGGYVSAKRDNQTVNLSEPFVNTDYYVMCTGYYGSDPNSYEMTAIVHNNSKSQFVVHRVNTTNNYLNTMMWLAIGRWK